MLRSVRHDAQNVLHHIIIHGIERRKIFIDDQDKDNITDRLAILLPETKTACYAWALDGIEHKVGFAADNIPYPLNIIQSNK